ncbi:hypothetical protein A3841_00230 [Pontibacter flavimaris]|uniref:DUF4238 domain-containing protein n=2 Tax=Pontibacter flavimaris TaxID=1797110 RepID=A0A1Q5PBW5_9BACT|nr:hypothetical protein A3841_00230 [Pontibacter flavimaris]
MFEALKMKKSKHHYLPECFIKNFTEDGKTYILDMFIFNKIKQYKPDASPSINPRSPGSICYIPDLHVLEESFKKRFPAYALLNELALENDIFGCLETEYGRIFPCIEKRQRLNISQAITFIKFLISLKLRNPYRVKSIDITSYLKDESINSLIEVGLSIYPNLPASVFRELIDSIAEEYSNDPSFIEQYFKGGLLRRHLPGGLLEKITSKLISYKWYLLEACTGANFISSDNPGFSISDNKSFNTKYDSNFSFFFPLSSTFCLYISDNDLENDGFFGGDEKLFIHQVISEQCVNEINEIGFRYKYRYIFAKKKESLKSFLPIITGG